MQQTAWTRITGFCRKVSNAQSGRERNSRHLSEKHAVSNPIKQTLRSQLWGNTGTVGYAYPQCGVNARMWLRKVFMVFPVIAGSSVLRLNCFEFSFKAEPIINFMSLSICSFGTLSNSPFFAWSPFSYNLSYFSILCSWNVRLRFRAIRSSQAAFWVVIGPPDEPVKRHMPSVICLYSVKALHRSLPKRSQRGCAHRKQAHSPVHQRLVNPRTPSMTILH